MDSNPEKKSKIYGGLAQLARAPALHAGGQRFESVILHNRISISSLTLWKILNERNV